MKMTQIKNLLSVTLCIVLVAAIALMTTACNGNQNADLSSSAITDIKPTLVGAGDTKFDFTVVDQNGSVSRFVVSTSKKTVGEALLDLGLIKGEDSQYGLYVKTVNGTTLEFDTDGMYWAFYVNDEYVTVGVDATKIKSGDNYTFRAQK